MKEISIARLIKIILQFALCLLFYRSLIGPFFPNEAMRHGVSLTACGFILSSFPLSVVLSAPLWGYSVPFLGPKILIIGGGIITGACVACFALIDNLHGKVFISFGL